MQQRMVFFFPDGVGAVVDLKSTHEPFRCEDLQKLTRVQFHCALQRHGTEKEKRCG